MKASKMINRLQKLIDKHGDLDVSMLGIVIENGIPVQEVIMPIRQIKYRIKLGKFYTDSIGGF